MSKSIEMQELYQMQRDILTAIGVSLLRIGEIGVSELSSIFKTEGSSHGDEWTALNKAYREQKVKAGDSEKILNRTGTLQQSFGYEVDVDTVTIGTNVPYAVFHEDGAEKNGVAFLPKRSFVKPVSDSMFNAGIPGIAFIEAFGGIHG